MERSSGPNRYTGTMTTMDDSGARAISGVTVVRDGTFAGVVAPTERLVRKAAAAVKADWSIPTDLPTSSSDLRAPEEDRHRRRRTRRHANRRGRCCGRSRAGCADVRRELPDSLHRARAARTAIGGRRVDRRQADGLDRHAAALRRSRPSSPKRSEFPKTQVRVIVPDTGSAYGGKHTGEHAIEAARLAKAAGKPVKLVWTRAEEFTFGYFRPAGVIDVKAGGRRRRADHGVGIRQLELGCLRDSDAVRHSQPADSVPSVRIAAPPGLVPRPCGDGESLRARDAHGRRRARARRRRRGVPLEASQRRADARRAHGRRAEDRLAETLRRRPRARYRVRNREGQLRRDRRRAVCSGERIQGRTIGRCLRVRCDRQP